jgi:hypothetical protein
VSLKFKIDFEIPKDELLRTYQPLFLIGSCFSVYQAEQLKQAGFPVFSNPFGINYNPCSISDQLKRIADQNLYQPSDFTEYQNVFFSFEQHGLFKYPDIQNAVNTSNKILRESRSYIKDSAIAIISLGTAIVFEYSQNQRIVCNCHKVPSGEFNQRFLDESEILDALKTIRNRLLTIKEDLMLIWTISPVRHLRSGVRQNSLSKAMLNASLNAFLSEHPEDRYFPSFEIFIDELRDYRFSGRDFMHPSEEAQEYIWERFQDCYFSEELKMHVLDVMDFRKFEAHIPRSDPNAHRDLIDKKRDILKEKIAGIQL